MANCNACRRMTEIMKSHGLDTGGLADPSPGLGEVVQRFPLDPAWQEERVRFCAGRFVAGTSFLQLLDNLDGFPAEKESLLSGLAGWKIDDTFFK